MEVRETIGLRCRRDGEKIKPVARDLGVAPNTVRKYLRQDLPPKSAIELTMFSWIAELTDLEIRDLSARNSGLSFKDAYRLRYGQLNPPEQLNTSQRIVKVATDIDEATTRIVQHLTSQSRH